MKLKASHLHLDHVTQVGGKGTGGGREPLAQQNSRLAALITSSELEWDNAPLRGVGGGGGGKTANLTIAFLCSRI